MKTVEITHNGKLVQAQQFEDGDAIVAVRKITRCDENGIDHVVGQQEISGVIGVKQLTAPSGRIITLVSLNSPFDPRAQGTYVALGEHVVDGDCWGTVLTNIRFV